MDPELDRYLKPAGRFMEVLVGLLVLAASGLLGYFGARGAWMYLHGSRAAPADPVATLIGLGAGIWGGYSGLRMLFGLRNDRALVPPVVLILGGVLALLGGAAAVILVLFTRSYLPRTLPMGITLGLVGVAAMTLGRKRMSK